MFSEAMRKMFVPAVLGLAVAASPVSLARPLELDDVAREGELRLLAERPDAGAYAYESHVHIDAQSLRDGVVLVQTCHRQLDPNARIVIMFNPQRVRSIDIVRADGVQRAWVDGHQVELAGVQRGATVCIDLRSRALDALGNGRWRLHAGPLMRRYIDGYLPMEAELRLSWPEDALEVVAVDPMPQPGVHLTTSANGARMHVIFAGRLTAHWELHQRAAPKADGQAL